MIEWTKGEGSMSQMTIALFGEAQKGDFRTGYFCQNLAQLSDCLGEPPSEDAKGLHLAVQTLLYDYPILFFRVEEEGFSQKDYLIGFQILQRKEGVPRISALCLPGVGDAEIIQASDPICSIHKSFLILTERDLYDYLTN